MLYKIDKHFLKTLITLAVPITLQNLITSSLNMVDSVMIGHLGEKAIAGVGIANQIFFLLNILLFGVFSGACIFAAQFWGREDAHSVRVTLGISLKIGCFLALVFTIVTLFFPTQIISVFNRDTTVITLGSEFLSINAFTYVIFAVTFCYAMLSRSVGNVRLPMYASIIALSINTLLNYALINGNLGFSPMGVRGAAIATLIARIVEVTIIVSAIYITRSPIAANFKEIMAVDKEFILRFFKTTLPVIIHESLWSIGMTVYTYVYGYMGVNTIATMNIVSTIERLALVTFFGMTNACAIIVGKRIGESNYEGAYHDAKSLLFISPIISVFMSLLLVASSSSILALYNVTAEVKTTAIHILIVIAIILPFRVANLIMVVGIIRAGGDTKFGLLMEILPLWFVAIPLVFISGKFLGFPIFYVYLLACTEEFIKLYFGLKRFFSRRWINYLAHSEKLGA